MHPPPAPHPPDAHEMSALLLLLERGRNMHRGAKSAGSCGRHWCSVMLNGERFYDDEDEDEDEDDGCIARGRLRILQGGE